MRISMILVPAVLLGLAACNGDDPDTTDDTDVDSDTTADETARIRLTHLGVFPDGMDSAVDIYVNGEASGVTFSFGDTTDYIELPVGSYDFAVVPAGGELGDAAATVEDFALAADESWAIVAQGYVAPGAGEPGLTVGAFQESYEELDAQTTRLNVFHSAAAPAFDPVDVWTADADCNPTGDAPLIDEFAYGATVGGVDIPVGAIGIALDVGNDGVVDACFQVPELPGEAVINVFAANDLDGVPFLLAQLPGGDDAQLDPVVVEPETAQLRLTHLGVFPQGAGSTDVDVWINGEKSPVTFGFQDTTDYIELEVGTYDFAIVPAGGDLSQAAATVEDFALQADESWAVYASGYVAPSGDEPALSLKAFQENLDGVPADSYRLNVVHGAGLPALDPVDVWVVDSECAPTGTGPLLDNFAFAQVQTDVDLPGGVNLGFDIGGNATVDACFTVPDLGDGVVANAFAVNDAAGNVSIVAQLPEGNKAVLTPVE